MPPMTATDARYTATDLLAFARDLLTRAGLPRERALNVAEVLLEGDLLGHTTHGLDLLARYLQQLADGRMATTIEPVALNDRDSAFTWDGCYLPGPWLVRRAIAEARKRLERHPVVTAVIRRSHHIGCLEAYLEPVARQGHVILLTCSDPSAGGVTPHGGVAPLITPNPIAAGFPTGGDPVLIDISMSTTTNAFTRRTHEEGGRLPGPWLVDPRGEATDDPAVLFGASPGAVLPLGGLDLGHKGFALALLVEALTSALAGHGRADEPKSWGASVFIQLIDPAGFGGADAFTRETSRLAAICHGTPVPPGKSKVRLPGEAAMARRSRQLKEGVALHSTVMPALRLWAERFDVKVPTPLPTPTPTPNPSPIPTPNPTQPTQD
jgi:LDH2 family malate/lactate/ureidoglycolate dehydrogenase